MYVSVLSILQVVSFLLIVKYRFVYKRPLYFIKRMSSYTIMAIAPTVLIPVVLIIIRGESENLYGGELTAIIQGSWRLGDAAITAFSGIISMYFLPKFSRSNHSEAIRSTLQFLKNIVPILVVSIIFFNLTAEFWVSLLLTNAMVKEIYFFKLYVNFAIIKVLCIFLGLHLVSHSKVKLYILSELIFIVSYFIFFNVFNSIQLGFYSVAYSYSISIFLTLLTLLMILYHFRKVSSYEI